MEFLKIDSKFHTHTHTHTKYFLTILLAEPDFGLFGATLLESVLDFLETSRLPVIPVHERQSEADQRNI